MKKRITWFLFLAVLFTIPLGSAFSSPAQATLDQSISIGDTHNHVVPMEPTYVGASTTGKFHYTYCRWAQKIRGDHRVYFDSREEAIDAGYVPCKVCQP